MVQVCERVYCFGLVVAHVPILLFSTLANETSQRTEEVRHSAPFACQSQALLSLLCLRLPHGQRLEGGLGSKCLIAAKDFPVARFFGTDHLQRLWKMHDLRASVQPGMKTGEKLQVQPFTSVFIIEYAFIPRVSTI
jgi:hypothetical protein